MCSQLTSFLTQWSDDAELAWFCFCPKNHVRKAKADIRSEWEEEFFFTPFKEKSLCFICATSVAIPKQHNVEKHFKTCHESFNVNYPPGRALRIEKVHALKAAWDKQWTFFTRPLKKLQKATEASFRSAHFLIKNKKAFLDGFLKKLWCLLLTHSSKIWNMVPMSSQHSPMSNLEQVR